MKRNKYAVVTGASSGIGYEIACRLAERGYNLVLVARDKKNLQDRAKELLDNFGVHVHCFCCDLAKSEDLKELFINLETFDDNVEVLVNNAGVGQGGEFGATGLDRELHLVRLNIQAVISMSYFYLSRFKSQGEGYILNVASLAAFQPGPYYANYYATKSYVLSFTEALAVEAKRYGISCCALCPGTTDTNFHKSAGSTGTRLSKGILGIVDSATRVSTVAIDGLFAGKRVVVPGLVNNLATALVRLVPRRLATTVTSHINR